MNFNIKSCFDGDDDECLSKNVKICGQRHAFFMLQTITYGTREGDGIREMENLSQLLTKG